MRSAVDTLAARLRSLGPDRAPTVHDRLPIVLTDLLGVTVAAVRTPEIGALLDAWPMPAGRCGVIGTSRTTTPETAALLSATAACSQELDEGNKYAAGHPAAHVVFAAVAAAQQADGSVSGARFLSAVGAGYEVAARFGRAVRRGAPWHTHGHWGATGAACAAALIGGGDVDEVAAAVDASTGLMTVAPWATVLAGDVTRNLWMGQANVAGLSAAHLAHAGLVTNRGGAYGALSLVGDVDPASLTADLGTRWLAAEGYVKQHAACSYTHAAVDLVLALRASGSWSVEDVVAVRVGTHSLAAPLFQRGADSRLAAMFSLPFVVATALVSGAVDPTTMEPGTPAFARARTVSERVDVRVVDALDGYLPDRRVTEVEIELADGTTVGLAQPDPIGDTAHFPFSADDVVAKVARLLGDSAGDRRAAAGLYEGVRALADADDVVAALEALPLVRA
ncbi:2-methylcitrate dehydratase PrpD [Mumia flava]|uniref:2-methylcitrate dehydratase PrpD n=1 Tax=Mumia flava TaxID=1348852 RepID=A0A2M9BE13_9ACTN|nr:MmgE/PrpD family protein [Mumia flava]PJJ56172.1 2-methylcitrate dehydratase PrpD [Mumia flava]